MQHHLVVEEKNVCLGRMATQKRELSRFEKLPPILQEKILGEISSPIDLLRLHATNRSIAATIDSIWFEKKIKELSVHIAGPDGGPGGPNLINDQAIPAQKIIDVFKYLWKRAPSITSLKVTGRVLENVDWRYGYARTMLKVLRQLMLDTQKSDTPRAIRELQMTIDRRYNQRIYYRLRELQDILSNVSATLENFELFIQTDINRGIHPGPDDCFDCLGQCSKLKKVILKDVSHFPKEIQTICEGKTELSHIEIQRKNVDWTQFHTEYSYLLGIFTLMYIPPLMIHFFLGILRGLDSNITCLHVDLSSLLPESFLLYDPVLDKRFPNIKIFTVTVRRHVDVRRLQKLLPWFMTHFPVLECIRIKSEQNLSHSLERLYLNFNFGVASYIANFFEKVVIDKDGTERTFRVSKFLHFRNIVVIAGIHRATYSRRSSTDFRYVARP